MPNAAARRSRKATSPTTNENSEGNKVMSTITVGDFQIEELEDYEFSRTGAGRKREPSPFDDVVNDWVGTTRRVEVESQEKAQEFIKQLTKACDYRKRGLRKHIEEKDGFTYVVFKVNPEKDKREPRKPKTEPSIAEQAEDAETE